MTDTGTATETRAASAGSGGRAANAAPWALQTLLATSAVLGFLWLTAIGVMGWLQLPQPETPFAGPLPVPTLMLLGGDWKECLVTLPTGLALLSSAICLRHREELED